jgi:phosphoribosylformylglycinamidine cyclo-ligase
MSNNKDIYSQLGVSSKKEDVHKAIQFFDKGLYPGSFCKIVQDVRRRDDFCSVFHSDGAGTKPSLAYMYFKELEDISIFKGIVQDAVVMNVDDMLCVGATGDYFISNNIGRNSRYVAGEIINTIIQEYYSYSKKLSGLGLNTTVCGGETADVGDVVKTLMIDASAFTSLKRKDIIDSSKISKSDVIVGLASSGKATYEDEFNSGIGSNGLTLARHGVLSHEYYAEYPECYDQFLVEQLVFFGNHRLTDKIKGSPLTIGKALLSPTRTYAPIILDILKNHRKEIHGIIHNTGGGQTKILNYGKGIEYTKNNLFQIPKIFEIIQRSSETHWKEMFQVFNMGHRMEIYCDETIAHDIIKISKKYKVDSKIIGYCQSSPSKHQNLLEIKSEFGSFNYDQKT